jgi:hypothetical protein
MKNLKQKQIEAKQRAIIRSRRSNREQLAFLDTKPGNAKRERARLNKQIK